MSNDSWHGPFNRFKAMEFMLMGSVALYSSFLVNSSPLGSKFHVYSEHILKVWRGTC